MPDLITEPPKRQVADRVTVVETVYHSPQEGEPTSFLSQFDRSLKGTDQVWQRTLVADEEWKPLDCGWVKSAGMMVIRNEAGRYPLVKPTEAEKVETAKHVLEVGYSNGAGCWLIRPGESMRGVPAELQYIIIRSRYGKTKYTLCLIPE